MSEARWLQSTQPYELLRMAHKVAPSRQLQLVAMNTFQLLDAALTEHQRTRVREMERLVWQNAVDAELQAQFQQHYQNILVETQAWQQQHPRQSTVYDDAERLTEAVVMAQAAMISAPVDSALYRVIDWVRAYASRKAGPGLARPAIRQVNAKIVALFHEVIGNPFLKRVVVGPRSTTPPTSWQLRISETAEAMARGIVIQQAFDRMPILADVLEEDGCRDTDLLDHLRSPDAVHRAGCWALDVVLQLR
jgi:hypothetical protein